MQTNAFPLWRVRAVTFFLAALVALSASYWVLKSMQGHSVSATAAAVNASPDPQVLARVLGGGQTARPVASGEASSSARAPYVLVGVLADRAQGGAALISVDGKPAKPFGVGATVDGDLVLQSVSGRSAVLAGRSQGAVPITLDMPALSK